MTQVLHANKLRAADVNGSSDPYCKVKLGRFKAKTRTLKKTLEPEWNETFMFVLEADDLALMGGVPVLSFEVWDHNLLARDYFLGEVLPTQHICKRQLHTTLLSRSSYYTMIHTFHSMQPHQQDMCHTPQSSDLSSLPLLGYTTPALYKGMYVYLQSLANASAVNAVPPTHLGAP